MKSFVLRHSKSGLYFNGTASDEPRAKRVGSGTLLGVHIKIQSKTLDEFRGCEQGADDDKLRGPSPLTTLEILARSEREIIVNTPEEAAQIADCCDYGTFPDFCPRAAERIRAEALAMPGALEILRRWQREEMDALAERVRELQSANTPSSLALVASLSA